MDAVFQNSWLLKGTSSEFREKLFELGEVIEVPPQQVVLQEGVPNDYLFLLLVGQLRAELPDGFHSSTSITVARREPGDLLGEYSYFDRKPPAVTLVADVKSRLFRIDHATIHALLKEDCKTRAAFFENILGHLVHRLRQADNELQVFAL